MLRTLQRYVFLEVARGVGIASGVILVMILLVDFVSLTRDLGDVPGATPLLLFGFSLMRALTLVETTLSFIVLFGAMWAMFRLNRRSELVVMRAAGMSAWRFIAPAMAFALVFGVFATAVINPAAARLNAEFERRQDALSNPLGRGLDIAGSAVWLREGRPDGQVVLRAGSSQSGGRELEHVTVWQYQFDDENRPVFRRRYDAASATLEAGFWRLRDAWENAPSAAPIPHDEISIPTALDPSRIVDRAGAPRNLSFWELPGQARRLQQAGFSHLAYTLRWQQLLALPLALAAMTVVASAASLTHARRGGAFRLAVLAAGVGFIVYFGDTLMGTLGVSGVLPAFVAAWAAPFLTLLAGLFVIATVEDG